MVSTSLVIVISNESDCNYFEVYLLIFHLKIKIVSVRKSRYKAFAA